jgi:hypothetical protein
MTDQPTHRVPETVGHEEFLAAIKPFLTLIGLTAQDTYVDLHITPPGRRSEALAVITATIVPRTAVSILDEYPEGVRDVLPPQENSELCHHVKVEVV